MEEKTEEELLEYLADLLVDIFFEREETKKKKNASTQYIQQLISVALLEEDFEHVTYLNAEDAKSFTVSLYDPTRRMPLISRKIAMKITSHTLYNFCWKVDRNITYRNGLIKIEVSKMHHT